jgi:hypothetical protein
MNIDPPTRPHTQGPLERKTVGDRASAVLNFPAGTNGDATNRTTDAAAPRTDLNPDLARSVQGMYRILDLISERGGTGGLGV